MPIDPLDAAKRGIVPVAVVAVDGDTVEITGDAVVDTTALEALIGSPSDEANDPTVIGLLKQIIVKLGDVETALGE
jgi:hypothetical protein